MKTTTTTAEAAVHIIIIVSSLQLAFKFCVYLCFFPSLTYSDTHKQTQYYMNTKATLQIDFKRKS